MKLLQRGKIVGPMVLFALLGIPAFVLADQLKAELQGFNEAPVVSTTGTGEFRAQVNNDQTAIDFELTYTNLEGTATTAAHIHLGQVDVNGGVIAFLCGGGGKPACPAVSGTVTGTIIPSDVIGSAGQGIAAGEFEEMLNAIRKGVTYVNVHSSIWPGGEIRGQIR